MGQIMGLYPAGGGAGGGRIVGGGDLHLPPPEHNHTVYCDQAHYVPVYGGILEARVKGGQEVVVAGRNGFGGDANGVLGGGTNEGVGGYRQDRDGDGLS